MSSKLSRTASLPHLHHQMAFLANPHEDEAVFDRVALPHRYPHVGHAFPVEIDPAGGRVQDPGSAAGGADRVGAGHALDTELPEVMVEVLPTERSPLSS